MTSSSEPCYIFCLKTGLAEVHNPDETKNYLYLEDCIKNEWCIDCVLSCLQYVDLSFEAMERRQFSVWFNAILRNRLDIVEKLIEYGCERYSEYKWFSRYGSYQALLHSFSLQKDNSSNTKLLENFLGLFLAAGIDPTVEATVICKLLNHIKSISKNYFFNAVINLLENYGFKKEILDTGEIIAVFEPDF